MSPVGSKANKFHKFFTVMFRYFIHNYDCVFVIHYIMFVVAIWVFQCFNLCTNDTSIRLYRHKIVGVTNDNIGRYVDKKSFSLTLGLKS